MHDIKYIRANKDEFIKQMARRGISAAQVEEIISLDIEARSSGTSIDELKAQANAIAKQIGMLKGSGQNADAEIAKSAELKKQIAAAKDGNAENPAGDKLRDILLSLPNIMLDEIPHGNDEDDNIEIYCKGDIPEFSFTPKSHDDIAVSLGELDFEQTAKISGARFATLKGGLASLERALANFMLDTHTKKFGYLEVSPPLLVRDDAMIGTGQLPKFSEDAFQTTDGRWLISTAEISITNLVREQIIDSAELPIRMTAHTPCFRSEAGSAGRDTKGLIRQHQFYKVELVSIVADEKQGLEELERVTNCAEEILQLLELPYRKVLLCSGDTGFGSKKTYDLEVWFASQNKYREISSCSYFGDFQARRMNTRHRPKGVKQTEFVHTLNGSGLAVGRCLAAIIENYQQQDGTIAIPDILKKYL